MQTNKQAAETHHDYAIIRRIDVGSSRRLL